MNPQTCTIILLKQTNPFYLPDNEEEQDATLFILESSFGHVHKETNLDSCYNYTKLLPSSSTILLIELDEILPSSQQIEMITKTVEKISKIIPIVVCSTNEEPQFMLNCIQAGATDYLLKPLRPDVIKTLFLSLYRRQHPIDTLYEDHLISSSTISSVHSVTSPITPTAIRSCQHPSAYLPDQIQDRIKKLNNKDINFTKAIIDTYMPHTSDTLPTYKPLNNIERQNLEKKVSTWDFSPLNLTQHELVHCAVIIISQVFTLPEIILFSQEQLYDFIIELSTIYHDENPYHNFAHAVDVLQCIYYFLCQLGLVPFADGSPQVSNTKPYKILRPRDIFALFIAAIGHDTAHPGVNNAFLINTAAPLALLYNDSSVLESFHSMTLFQLLKKHKFEDILGGTSSTEYIAYEWAQILIEEFTTQGDLERELGMEVSPMNDRTLIVLEDSQIGFIRFIALGLFESVSVQLQELSFPVDYIKKNLSIWEDRKRENIERNHHQTLTDKKLIRDEHERSSSSSTTATEDYQVQAVNALSMKGDLDSNFKLTAMPAMSMTSISLDHKNRDFDQQSNWDPRESSGPVYCQCTIQ